MEDLEVNSWQVVAGRCEGWDLSGIDDIEFRYEKLLIWQRSLEWADRILSITENIGTKRNK